MFKKIINWFKKKELEEDIPIRPYGTNPPAPIDMKMGIDFGYTPCDHDWLWMHDLSSRQRISRKCIKCGKSDDYERLH